MHLKCVNWMQGNAHVGSLRQGSSQWTVTVASPKRPLTQVVVAKVNDAVWYALICVSSPTSTLSAVLVRHS